MTNRLVHQEARQAVTDYFPGLTVKYATRDAAVYRKTDHNEGFYVIQRSRHGTPGHELDTLSADTLELARSMADAWQQWVDEVCDC